MSTLESHNSTKRSTTQEEQEGNNFFSFIRVRRAQVPKNRRRLADIARSLIHDCKLTPTITSSACEPAESTTSLDHFSLWKWYSLFEI